MRYQSSLRSYIGGMRTKSDNLQFKYKTIELAFRLGREFLKKKKKEAIKWKEIRLHG